MPRVFRSSPSSFRQVWRENRSLLYKTLNVLLYKRSLLILMKESKEASTVGNLEANQTRFLPAQNSQCNGRGRLKKTLIITSYNDGYEGMPWEHMKKATDPILECLRKLLQHKGFWGKTWYHSGEARYAAVTNDLDISASNNTDRLVTQAGCHLWVIYMALLYVIFSRGPRLTQKWLRDLSADRKENVMNHMMALKASAQSDTSHFPHLTVTAPSLMAVPDFKKGPI